MEIIFEEDLLGEVNALRDKRANVLRQCQPGGAALLALPLEELEGAITEER